MLSASISGDFEFPEFTPYVFEGPFKADVRVQVYGMFRTCLSLSNVCAQIGQQLTAAIDGTALHSYNGLPFFQKSLEHYSSLNTSAPIGFFHGIPDAVPEFFFEHQTTIGGFACETNAIPPGWVQTCNKFDLIIVPSKFCQTVFSQSGVTVPILVVRHGLEPEYTPLREKARSERFVFYNTFSSYSFPGRKSCEELIRCFQRAFHDRSDVQLRLRVQKNALVRECLHRYQAHSLVCIDPSDNATTSDFASIYSDVHCTVHPSKGEGFGLIPFQSIACETPVIAPYATGMTEYLSEENAMLLRTHGEIEGTEVYYKTGTYHVIDEDHLVDLLRYAESHWESEYQKVRHIAPQFREKHSWERVLTDFVTLMKDLTESPDPRERREIIQTKVTASV